MERGTCWVKHKPRLKIFKKTGVDFVFFARPGWVGCSLAVHSTGGGRLGTLSDRQNLFQGILVALRGDQDRRVGSFDISVEKSWTLFSGVELVSFNFGLPGWVGFLEVFGKKKDWDL